jgi:hypothetical protein
MTQTEELAFLENHCADIGGFARRGQIQDWLVKKNEEACIGVRKAEEET